MAQILELANKNFMMAPIIMLNDINKNILIGTSLVAQWLRIHLLMQGTWV